MRRKSLMLSLSVWVLVSCLGLAGAGSAAAADSPAQTAARSTAERWVAEIGNRNQRAACELQAVPAVGGRPCASLPTSEAVSCPAVRKGAKPPYRKSEVRTAAEQVGAFTEESPNRGFFRIDPQVKAKKGWGTIGVEGTASGAWLITYLRYGDETFSPAGASYGSEAWHRLWVSNWCPTTHPHWAKKG